MNTILRKENIILNCPKKAKKEVLEDVGRMLYESGYTTEKYTEALMKKETIFNTAIGNDVAIPHGEEEMRGEILKSGIVVLVFPDGTDWDDGNVVKLVIGIAGVGNEHVEILSNIACLCSDEESVAKITRMNVDEIYELFTTNQ